MFKREALALLGCGKATGPQTIPQAGCAVLIDLKRGLGESILGGADPQGQEPLFQFVEGMGGR